MSKRRRSRSTVMWAILAAGIVAGAAAFSAGYVNPASQLAVGTQSDAQCLGGEDAKCQCNTGFAPNTKNCDGRTRGGGKIGCPCQDITSGQTAASGKCETVGKCKADQAGGMMPMLPMLPMMMPKMPMPPMPEQPCVPKPTMTATASTSTPATTDSIRGGLNATECPPNTISSSLSQHIFGGGSGAESSTTTRTSTWGSLLNSLLGVSDTESEAGEDEQGTSTDAERSGGHGFFEGIRRGVQTIVMLTTVRPNTSSSAEGGEWGSTEEGRGVGYIKPGSTFGDANLGSEVRAEPGALLSLLDTLGSALWALLDKLKP